MKICKMLKRSAFALILSMSAMPNLVNGQAPVLTNVNNDKSAKDTKAGLTKLIAITLKSGIDSDIGSSLAPVIGLQKAMPMKKQEVVTSEHDDGYEKRSCFVIYENVDSTAPAVDTKRAVCAYIVKIKRSGLDNQIRYFRIDLNGKLEKVVLSQSKYDNAGKVVRGSGVKFDQDINSPEVKKTFEAEMKFWLKDWLKKEQKSAAKKSAAAATPVPTTP
jgi:hypothetical protein